MNINIAIKTMERERDRSERNTNPHHWTTVSRKKPRTTTNIAQKTCFINFLPENIIRQDLHHLFSRHGEIENIHIPAVAHPHRRYRYAFVKFRSNVSLVRAIRGEDGRVMGNNRIRTHPAKRDKAFPTAPPPNTNPHHQLKKTQERQTTKLPHSSTRDHRSYKEVSLNLKNSQTRTTKNINRNHNPN